MAYYFQEQCENKKERDGRSNMFKVLKENPHINTTCQPRILQPEKKKFLMKIKYFRPIGIKRIYYKHICTITKDKVSPTRRRTYQMEIWIQANE